VRPEVSTVLVGALEPHHLTEAVAALDIKLAAEDIAHLEGGIDLVRYARPALRK